MNARHLALGACAAFAGISYLSAQAPAPAAAYVGSAACSRCHAPIFNRWKQTRMANVLRDPREHPDAIVADFSRPNPLVTFTKEQIAFVYGSKFKQRLFTKRAGTTSPAAGDMGRDESAVACVRRHRCDQRPVRWMPFGQLRHRAEDRARNGTSGANGVMGPAATTSPTRHGRKSSTRHASIRSRRSMCVSNVTLKDIHPPRSAVRDFHWPVGFEPGLRLADFWRLDEHVLGQMDTLHFPDGNARENRMQGNDFVQSLMYTRGVTCASCHDPHGTPNNADLIKPARAMCLTCHGPKSPNGPRAATIEAAHASSGRIGRQRVCQLPHAKIAEMLGDVMVRSHTFKFISPAEAERLKMPDRVHRVSYRQVASVGDGGAPELAGLLAVARWTVAVLFGALSCGVEVIAAQPQPDRARIDTPVATARRATGTIRVDGRLDEPDWKSTRPIGPAHAA